jgi:DNA polymerase elongation subunit (family B)
LDWYECDLRSDIQIERKDSYLNQEHNKSYTIFIFGVTVKGHSICLRVKNYLPYFFVQVPDEFTPRQTADFLKAFDAADCDDYDSGDIENYNDAIAKKDFKTTEMFKFNSRYYKDAVVSSKSSIVQKKVFWTFMNEQKFKFIKVAHKSKQGHRFMERVFKNPKKLKITGKTNTAIKYNLYESDLEPILRFLHDTKVKPSSWIKIAGSKFKNETHQSKTQINISCDWTENDVKMVQDFRDQMQEMFEKAGYKNIRTADSKSAPGADIHEMGGVRMGKDPKNSILNEWNQVHGCKNVFISDGACMTSTSTQNPTLTYMAFAARAANHAVDELNKKNL